MIAFIAIRTLFAENRFSCFNFLFIRALPLSLIPVCRAFYVFDFFYFFIDHFVTSSMHTNMDEMDDKEVRIGLARMWLIFVLLCDSKHFTIFHFRSIDSFLVK